MDIVVQKNENFGLVCTVVDDGIVNLRQSCGILREESQFYAVWLLDMQAPTERCLGEEGLLCGTGGDNERKLHGRSENSDATVWQNRQFR